MIVAAYAHMVAHARQLSPTLPANTFYALWPRSSAMGLPPPPALGSNGKPVADHGGSGSNDDAAAAAAAGRNGSQVAGASFGGAGASAIAGKFWNPKSLTLNPKP